MCIRDRSYDDYIDAIETSCPTIPLYAIGDIIIKGEKGAQIILLNKYMNELNNLKNIKDDILLRPLKEKLITTVEASLRLDAIASAGFGISRNKVTKMIDKGEIFVDYKRVKTASTKIAKEQTISIRAVSYTHLTLPTKA